MNYLEGTLCKNFYHFGDKIYTQVTKCGSKLVSGTNSVFMVIHCSSGSEMKKFIFIERANYTLLNACQKRSCLDMMVADSGVPETKKNFLSEDIFFAKDTDWPGLGWLDHQCPQVIDTPVPELSVPLLETYIAWRQPK